MGKPKSTECRTCKRSFEQVERDPYHKGLCGDCGRAMMRELMRKRRGVVPSGPKMERGMTVKQAEKFLNEPEPATGIASLGEPWHDDGVLGPENAGDPQNQCKNGPEKNGGG